MTNDNFKKLLDDSLKPLQIGLSEVRTDLSEVKTDVNKLKTSLNEVKKDLKEVKDTQEERVLPSVTYVETTIKSYADRYVANEDHIRRLAKRLNTIEGNLGIQPPEELFIPPAE